MVLSILPSRLKRSNSSNGSSNLRSTSPLARIDAMATIKDLGLVLKVVILRARNLAAKDRNGTSDPYLVLTLGDYKVTTHSVPKTLNPEWNVIESMPVISFQSLLLEVICWDKDRFGKDYLGEFDVALEEIFTNGRTSLEPLWFPLKSKRPGKKTSVVSGEVALQFTLLDSINPQATHQQVLDKLAQVAAALPTPTPRNLTPTMTPLLSPTRPARLGQQQQQQQQQQYGPAGGGDGAGEDDEVDELDLDGDDDEDQDLSKPDAMETRRRRIRVKGLRRKKRRNPYEFASSRSDVVGIIFLEIRHITDLPPESNVMRTGFDMDPFVVASLGKKTYRTRHVRHNLNPVFNEKMLFQVSGHEQAYSFGFTVIDHDKVSGNDFIASCNLPVADLIERAPQANPDTGLYELPDVPECVKSCSSSSSNASRPPRSILKLGISRTASTQSLTKLIRPSLSKNSTASSVSPTGGVPPPPHPTLLSPQAPSIPSAPTTPGLPLTPPPPTPPANTNATATATATATASTTTNTNPMPSPTPAVVPPSADPPVTLEAAEAATIPVTAAAAAAADCDEWGFSEFAVPLRMKNIDKWESKHNPVLYLRAKYMPYAALRQQFWRSMLRQYDTDETGMISKVELTTMLDTLGSTLRESTIDSFFQRFPHRPVTNDGSWELDMDEAVLCLEDQLEARGRSHAQAAAQTIVDKMKSLLPDAAKGMLSVPGGGGGSQSQADPKDSQSSLSEASVSDVPSQSSSSSSSSPPPPPGTSLPQIQTQPTQIPTGSTTTTTTTAPTIAVPELQTPGEEGELVERDDLNEDRGEEHVIEIRECPICHMPRLNKRNDADIVTHIATCASQDWRQVNTLMMGGFVTVSQAQRKWYSKVITKISYGGYKLGANSANILVQDRTTGQISEEKMSVYVRLGIRLLYKGLKSNNMENKRIRRLLKSLSIKQGKKFDDPASKEEIPKFVQFHRLDLSEVLLPLDEFHTFNEFFYRALKPDARPCSAPDNPRIIVSPADCRSVVFDNIDHATRIWVKGREFSVRRLLGDAYPEDAARYERGGLGIFRLAPQDYHRFHIPVDGLMGRPKTIEGEYYTVNPMAIRSALDVYGENVRVLVPIDSPEHGRVMVICVGAMMVGSTVITAREGSHVQRADELGYFKFGGSTIVLLFEEGKMRFDDDLVDNSNGALETLIRAGMSIGHSPGEPQWKPDMRKSDTDITEAEKKEAKRRIQGSVSSEVSPDASGDDSPEKTPKAVTPTESETP